MTYLQMVNAVLRRLREKEVTTVQGLPNQNTYARLIGDFINEAKTEVENAWDWSALRTTMTVTTQDDIFNYILVGSGNRFEVLNVINDSDDRFMEYRPGTWFDKVYLMEDIVKGAPAYYNFNGVDPNGDTQVDLYPKPDGAYTLRFNVIKRTPELTADTDKALVPSRPIILLAYAMAIEERGEDGGNSSMYAYQMSRSAMADEIALDAARHPENTLWTEV
jgi:hypothetical protein